MDQFVLPIDDMDMKAVYSDLQVVQVPNEEVGSLVLQDDQQVVFNENQQVVYQTTAPAQYQQPQQATPATHFIIGSDDLAQQQQQQHQQVVLHQTLAEQHRQQQVHYQQQQQEQQLHLEQQQQQQQQYVQQQQQSPIQHVQQTQQIYYTSEQVLQPTTIVQHASMAAAQQQLQQKKQQQQQQVQVLQQQQYQQQYQQQPAQLVQSSPQQQQHQMLQSSPQQQQQQTLQLQTQPAQQQQPQQHQQIVYRMATTQPQRQINMLNNTHVLVQQPTGQQVLIQTPQHQEHQLIMRQATAIPQQGINIHSYNSNRVVYTTTPQQQHALLQQSPQHVQPQQQHVQLQASPLHTQTAHLVPTRVVQQQQQGNVVYQQVHMQKATLPQSPQQQQQQQQQVQQQQQQQQVSHQTQTHSQQTQIVRTVYRSKTPRGGAVAARQTTSTLITTRPQLTPTGGAIMRQVRPRGALQTVSGGIVRTMRPGMRATRPGTHLVVQTQSTSTGETQTMQIVSQSPNHLVQGKPVTITNLGQPIATSQQQMPRLYRTQMVSESAPQQQQQQHLQMIRQTHIRYRTPATISAAPQAAAVVNNNPTTGGSSNSSNLGLDLEERIQAAVVKKDQQKPVPASSVPMQIGGGTTLTTYYQSNNTSASSGSTSEEEQQAIRAASGASMSLAEFKKRNTLNASPGLATMRQVSSSGATLVRAANSPATVANKMPTAALPQQAQQQPQNANIQPNRIIQQPQRQLQPVPASTAATTPAIPQPQASSVQQTSHNNYEIHSQHVLNNRANQQIADRDRNSAKMLVILASGEQRLITFTLPRESCTVQDLLEQVCVPFDNNTTIQCVEHRGANVDFVVTVGFSVNESASELISRAEESLQMNRQQENAAATASTTPSPTAPAYSQATAAAEQVKRDAATTANTANAATTATAKAAASSEEPARKLIDGFYAVCQLCGFTGMDHAKCERCKRVFQEPPKRKSYVVKGNNTANVNAVTTSEQPGATAAEKKREMAAARFSKQINYVAGPSGRGGRGSLPMRGGRSRGARRAAEADPVVLLSSEDEGDVDETNGEASNQSTGNEINVNAVQAPMAFSFEPMMDEIDEEPLYKNFVRGDVTDLSDTPDADKFSAALSCVCMRLMPYRFEITEPLIFTSKGVRIVGIIQGKKEQFVLNIYRHEVIKVIVHFASTAKAQSLVTLYLLKTCAQYVKKTLHMPDDSPNESSAFNTNGSYQMRRLVLLFDTVPNATRDTIMNMFNCVDEISSSDAAEIFKRIAESERKSLESSPPPRQLRPDEQISLLMYPPKGTGGLCIRMEDFVCLTKESYLNDIIIDFYLLWVRNTIIPEAQRERTHIFSTFFYKRLTTLTRPTDVKQTAAQKRHARVQKWTKGVDIFDKDFIIVPINEQSHWFLAIICFPCLKGPVTYDTNQPVEPQQLKRTRGKKVAMQIGNTTITPLSKREGSNLPTLPTEISRIGDDESERDEAEGDDSDMASEDSENSNSATALANRNSTSTPITKEPLPTPTPTSSQANKDDEIPAVKQPLILIFDSLAGASRSRVVATLRDYLTCEYKIKKPDAQAHVFNKDNMPGHCVKVPQQNNFTDCGLYLLQYVEQFFNEPIRDYRLPIKQLTNWFDLLTVTKKREDIAILIQRLMDENNTQRRLILPVIEFPTLNGQLVEYPEESESAEFEEEEGPDEEESTTDFHDENNAPTDMEVDPTPEELQQAKTINTRIATPLPATGTVLNTGPARRFVLKRRVGIGASVSSCSTSSNNGPTTGNGEAIMPHLVATNVTGTPRLTAAAVSGSSGSLKIRKIEQ